MCFLARRDFASRWIDENLHFAPPRIRTRVRLLAHPQSLELTIVESEVLHQILAYDHRPGLGQHQILLGIALHPSGCNDYRKTELVIRQELAAGVETFLILQLGRILLIEKLLRRNT